MPTKTTAASMVYGGLVSTISTWCEEMWVPYAGVTVSSVRKLITGKANAAKAKIPQFLASRYGIRIEDPDEADALAVLAFVIETKLQAGLIDVSPASDEA